MRKLPKAEHLARSAAFDLYLDTTLQNAHTTAVDALWSGLALVTLPSRAMASRVAASILSAGEFGCGVVRSRADYVDVALALLRTRSSTATGGGGSGQAATRAARNSNSKGSALFDTAAWVRRVESAFRLIWDAHVAAHTESDCGHWNVVSTAPRTMSTGKSVSD